jgi:hypothetical protein
MSIQDYDLTSAFEISSTSLASIATLLKTITKKDEPISESD